MAAFEKTACMIFYYKEVAYVTCCLRFCYLLRGVTLLLLTTRCKPLAPRRLCRDDAIHGGLQARLVPLVLEDAQCHDARQRHAPHRYRYGSHPAGQAALRFLVFGRRLALRLRRRRLRRERHRLSHGCRRFWQRFLRDWRLWLLR